MIAKIQKMLRYTVFCALGFGVAGAVLGFIHTTEDEWMWLAGFGLIGGFVGAALALVTGKYKMLLKLVVSGALVGALSQWMISSSDIEPWLQMTILGALFGAFVGIVISLFEKDKKPPKEAKTVKEKTFECDECGQMVRESDNFCPGCGIEFE